MPLSTFTMLQIRTEKNHLSLLTMLRSMPKVNILAFDFDCYTGYNTKRLLFENVLLGLSDVDVEMFF